MSLVLSLRIPDGIVTAADSLATVRGQHRVEGEFESTCSECGHREKHQLPELPELLLPSSTFSFAQKLFPFANKKFAVGSFGRAVVNGQTMYSHIEELKCQQELQVDGVSEAGVIIGEYFHNQLTQELGDIQKLPKEVFPIGMHVVGYDQPPDPGDRRIAKTIAMRISREVEKQYWEGFGCTANGGRAVLSKLWELSREDRRQQAAYPIFSLQDAIDYVEFLIDTTARYQRFANMIPTVGGDVDITLITPYKGFVWIHQKELAARLEADSD